MELICKICDKKYKSYKSLWNHNNKFHRQSIVIQPSSSVIQPVIQSNPINNEANTYFCSKCNKSFKFRQGKWKHEQKCTEKKINKTEIDDIKNENLEIKKENAEIKAEMEKLKELLQKSLKIHPKTLQKINNQLNNTTNNTINNITYVQLGREDLVNVLSDKQKMGILNRNVMGINDLVELIHVSGRYKKFMNVYITNLQNTIAYCYNEKQNNFIAVNKNELLNDLIDSRMYDIEKFYDEVEPVLEEKKAKNIKRFIERMKNEEDCLKGIKKDEIKLILYNNKDKIMLEKDTMKELEKDTMKELEV